MAEASPESGELRWVEVELEGGLPAAGQLRPVGVEGRALLLCTVEGRFFAVEDRCSHMQVPLCDGRLEGAVLECPLHGGKIDVRNGSPVALPIRKPVQTFPVRLEGECLEIGMPPER